MWCFYRRDLFLQASTVANNGLNASTLCLKVCKTSLGYNSLTSTVIFFVRVQRYLAVYGKLTIFSIFFQFLSQNSVQRVFSSYKFAIFLNINSYQSISSYSVTSCPSSCCCCFSSFFSSMITAKLSERLYTFLNFLAST